MPKIRLGIVGAGAIARRHLDVIRAIDTVVPVGIFSRTREKAEALAVEFGIEQCTDSLRDLVAKTRPDALMILVSVNQIAPVTHRAFEYGLPLFVEKPAGMTLAENEQLAEMAYRKSVPNMVGLNRRYYSIFHKGIELVKSKGALLGVAVEGHERMWRIRAAGKFPEAVLDNWIFANSIHTIDLLRLFGGEITECLSLAAGLYEKSGDQFAAMARFESGALGQYNAHWYSPGGWKVALYGDGVTVTYQPLETGTWQDREFKEHALEPDPVDREYSPGLYNQMQAFAKMIRNNRLDWPGVDIAGAGVSMQIAARMMSDVINVSGSGNR